MVVIHIRDQKKHVGPYVYIGRPGPLGNPFRVGYDGTRDEVIAQFEQFVRGNSAMIARIRALPKDAVLGCYCKPQSCHGDVIVKIWKELHHD